MVVVRTLLILLGALAVLTLGATPMTAAAEAPPCHSQDHQPPADQPASKALKIMACCVACVAAPRIEPPSLPAAPAPAGIAARPPAPALAGLTPSPAHGPPRA